MEVLEQQLLGCLKKRPNIDLKELKRELKISSDAEEYLEKIIFDLEVKGLVYQNKNGTYCLMENKPSICHGKAHFLLSGDMIVTDDYGCKVIVPRNKADGVLEKDIVCVNKSYVDNKNNIYGTIDKIIKRKTNQISCEVVFENGKNMLIPYNSKSKSKIRVDQKSIDKHGVGEILLVRLTTKSSQFDGHVEKIIGHKNEPDVDEKTIAYDHGFESDFSPKAIKELEKIPNFVDYKQALKEGRKDLRDKNVFTIDGEDTKDIDDSICIEILPNGNYKLYVNIADVAYYVKEGTAISNDAYQRATSVYMNDTVLPMLPAKISNGICSLHPNVDRLAKTCEMIINKDGKVVDYDIYDSIICSKKKMTYEDVNKILIENEMVNGYEPFYEDLKIMSELSDILNKAKNQRGYLNLSKSELKAKGKGQSIQFQKRTQQAGERIIENFMLLANQTVAEHIYYRGLPFIYRIHEAPEEDKIHSFLDVLEKQGIEFKNCKNVTSNKYIQNIIESINKNEDAYEALSELLLINTMKKAKYSNISLRHFGLALQQYTHFTSPIRRFADLQVHRLLNLYNKTYNIDYNELDKFLKEVANHCSKQSNEADKAEREAKEMRIAEFMENNIGNVFDAVIIDINSTQVKVRTQEGFYGIISINDLPNDNYHYDSVHNKLVGNNNIYTIGSSLKIKVKEASKKARIVKFTSESKQLKNNIQKTKKRK